MSVFKIKSYAKINLALNIINKSRGMHKIESLIAFINLYDLIYLKKINSSSHSIIFKGKFSRGIKYNNTISKLFKILERKKLINQKFQIKIIKNIPQKAGLGGGSMNAANILKYLIIKKIIKIDRKEILKITKYIGSDVILGLDSTNSILTSKNKIKRFRKCKRLYTLLVKPSFGCSTKRIYSYVKKFDQPKFNKPNKKMFDRVFLKKMSNSLEQIVLNKYSTLKRIKSYLNNLENPIFVRMTGSGSALVSYYNSKKLCDRAKKQFNRDHKNYWCISSKTI